MTVARRLAAILAADVAGYSRLMGADEEGTLERLKALRHELVDPKIVEHHGRIVKTTGDGMLVEFPSVVDAVRCAVAVQQTMPEHNAGVGPDDRIELRIGINLGDVIVEGNDLYGDGVNIAARIEALADAGGVFVSNTVHDHVRDRLPFVFEDLGEQQVKNIARPVRVYRVRDAGATKSPSAPMQPVLPLPDKPSIAVLGTESLQTPRWRKTDSNSPSHFRANTPAGQTRGPKTTGIKRRVSARAAGVGDSCRPTLAQLVGADPSKVAIWPPSGLPRPVQASQPRLAWKSPLLPCVISCSAVGVV